MSMILAPPITHPVPYRLLIFDADGTLRRCTIPGQPCPNRPGEWELLPNVRDILEPYDVNLVGIDIVSNQGGIGLGYLTESMARFLLQETLSEATGRFIGPDNIWLCPHVPSARCLCRKPAPLLLEHAQTRWHSLGLLDGPEQALFIGDQDTDREAAARAGIAFCWSKDFFGWGRPHAVRTT